MNSLRKTIVSVVAVASAVAFAAPVNAEYPPVEDVKPSTRSKEVSYDRTPGTVDPASRIVATPVGAGTVVSAKVYVGEAFTCVMPNIRPATTFRVSLTTPNGTVIQLPSIKSLKNGRLRLPTAVIAKSGTYVFKVTAPNGALRTVRVNAGK